MKPAVLVNTVFVQNKDRPAQDEVDVARPLSALLNDRHRDFHGPLRLLLLADIVSRLLVLRLEVHVRAVLDNIPPKIGLTPIE